MRITTFKKKNEKFEGFDVTVVEMYLKAAIIETLLPCHGKVIESWNSVV